MWGETETGWVGQGEEEKVKMASEMDRVYECKQMDGWDWAQSSSP